MNYLIQFDQNGRRGKTYVLEEQTEEAVQAMLDNGFELVPEEAYQLLIGNVDGKEYIRTYDTEGNPLYVEYEPPQPSKEEKNKAAAAVKKAELQNEAAVMMLSVLAGGSLTEAQTAYAAKINEVPDNVAGYIPEVFPVWSGAGVQYEKNQRIQYNGVLYKVLTAHPSQESWKPDVSPSLFVKVISSISGEISEWQQPSADNAYQKGDRVRFNGRIYESIFDGDNVWSPEAYPAAWKDITDEIGEA